MDAASQIRALPWGKPIPANLQPHNVIYRVVGNAKQQQIGAQQAQQQANQTSQQIANKPDTGGFPDVSGAMAAPAVTPPPTGGVHPTGVTGPVQGISLTPPPSGAGGSPPNPTGPIPGASGTQGSDGATPPGAVSPGFGAATSAQQLALPPGADRTVLNPSYTGAPPGMASNVYLPGEQEMQAAGIKRSITSGDVQATLQRIQSTPQLKAVYDKLSPMQQVEMIMGQQIQRELIPRTMFGPVTTVQPGEEKTLPPDYMDPSRVWLPGEQKKHIMVNGQYHG